MEAATEVYPEHLKMVCTDQQWLDVHDFARHQIASRDCDPLYPVLRYVHKELCNGEEQRLWLTLLYVAYYNLPSALRVYRAYKHPEWLVSSMHSTLPTGIERRGLRGGAPMVAHLHSLYDYIGSRGSISAWLQDGFHPEELEANWLKVQENIQQAWGNGRWAAYKLAEILQKVHDWPLVPTDMGHAWSSGPRKGLARLFPTVEGNRPEAVRVLDEQSELLYNSVRTFDIQLDIAEMETVLCDFNSMCKGNYYVGHDTDELLERTLAMPAGKDRALIMEARAATLPEQYLGERRAGEEYKWSGVDHERNKHYKLTGEILTR